MRARAMMVAALLAGGCGGGGGGEPPPPDACGDHRVTAGEACDDGNQVSGDGCDANCTVTACGNGIVTAGEACEGLDLGGRGCADLGYAGGALACTTACQLDTSACVGSGSVCGDGVLQPGEQCDDHGTVGGDGCSATCQLEQPDPLTGTGWFAPGGIIGEASP